MELLNHVVVEVFLIGLLIFTEIRNYKERSSLMNRLMAKDLGEYATYENEQKKVKIPEEKPESELVYL